MWNDSNEIYCPNYNFLNAFPITLQSKCNADKQKLGWEINVWNLLSPKMTLQILSQVFKFVSTSTHLWSLHRLLKHILFSNILNRFYLLIFFCLSQNVVSNAKGKYLFCNWHLLLYLCSFVVFCTLTKYFLISYVFCFVYPRKSQIHLICDSLDHAL